MKRLLLFLIAIIASASTLGTLADITGDGSAHALTGSKLLVWTADITALSTNGAACRIGDSNVSSSRGQVVAAGGSYRLTDRTNATSVPQNQRQWDLSTVYYLCGNGDKLTVIYAQ